MKKRKQMHIELIELEKAFDRVDQSLLLKIIYELYNPLHFDFVHF